MAATILSDTPRTARFSLQGDRLAGVAGLVFVVAVVFQNIVHAAIDPAAGATGNVILASLTDHRPLIEFMFGLFVIELVALMVFAAAAYRRALGTPSAWLARVGLLGVAGIVTFFSANVAIEAALTGSRTLSSAPATVEAMWALHQAFFGFNFAAIGTALLGLSLATAAAGIVPRWFRVVGPIGAVLLVAGALPIVPTVRGSMAGMAIALPGFVIWIVWMLFASAAILRSPDAE